MNLFRTLLSALSVLCLAALTSCGVSRPLSNLNGNWNLIGNAATNQLPALSATILVANHQVNANLVGAFACSPNSGSSLGGVLTGAVAADGSFTMTTVPESVTPQTQITITGTVPANAAGNWSGTYSIVNSSQGCGVSQAGSFTATGIAPVDGTYSGIVSNSPLGTGITVSTQISQLNVPVPNPFGASFAPILPLTGTIQVSGSTCFTQGSTNAVGKVAVANQLIGSEVEIGYQMNDGSTLLIGGQLSDAAATVIGGAAPAFLNVIGGKCGGDAGTITLTRQ
jgi:hypothetical protein